MKYFLPLLACIVLISCSHSSNPKKNDLELLHYNGRVKIVTYKIYKAKEDSGKVIKGNIISKVITKCDSAGYFVEQSNYKGGERLIYQVVRHYDIHSNLIMEERVEVAVQYLTAGNTKPDSLSVERDTFALKLDTKGNILEKKVSENGKPFYRFENKFDEKGNMIQSEEYVPWDTLNKTETYKYDDKGYMIEKTFTSGEGKLLNRYSYVCDDKGNNTTLLIYGGDGSMASKETMKYDDKGNKIADTKNKADGTSIYDWRYEFSGFDEKGNWLKEVTYMGGKPQSWIERTLEYY